jgi:CRP/FNR family cyclic AMP-dependent transcriptional regulator
MPQHASHDAHVPALARSIAEAFPHSRPESREALLAAAEIRTARAREIILAQGEPNEFVLVVQGLAALRRNTPEGRQVIPRIISSGDLGGLLGMLDRPTSLDVVALSGCVAAILPGPTLRTLASHDAGLALDALDHALVALDHFAEKIDDLLHQGAQRRVARVLHQHRELFFSSPEILTRAHLPALVGTSREMTGRVIRRLESHGIVRRSGRSRLELLDPVGLQAAAQPDTTRGEAAS